MDGTQFYPPVYRKHRWEPGLKRTDMIGWMKFGGWTPVEGGSLAMDEGCV